MINSTIEYMVKTGDTLYAIARRYNVTVEAICLHNAVSDVNRIWAGQVLKIPQERPPSSPPLQKPRTYRVGAGETLSEIAQHNNVTVAALVQANGLRDPNHITIGQVLKLPKESQPTRQAPTTGTASTSKAPTSKGSSAPVSKSKPHTTQGPKPASYKPGKTVASFGRVRNDDGLNLRERPIPGGAVQKKLPFNTRIFVSHELPGDWYFVTLDDGSFGYVFSKYVSLHPPDPEATLHKIKPNESALEIVQQHYKVKPNVSALGFMKQLTTGRPLSLGEDWGQDERYYVNVLVEANRAKELSGIYKPHALAAWSQTQTRENYLIWIPSLSFAKSLRGKVGSGSISYEAWQAVKNLAEAVGNYVLGHAAFSAGLIHGILESIWDLLTGLVDLVELVWKIIKSLITGEFLSDLKSLWDFIEQLDFKALMNLGLEAFRARWNHKNFLKRWHFRGWVVGYAIAEIVMAVITGSAALVKWAGKAGKFSKLIAKLPKVVKLAEKVTTASKSVSTATKQRLWRAISQASENLPGVKRLTPLPPGKTPSVPKTGDRLKALQKSKAAATQAEAQYQAALKKFRTTLRASLVTLNSGVNPELIARILELGYTAAKARLKRFDVLWQELKGGPDFKDLGKLSPEQLDELALAFKKGFDQQAADEDTIARVHDLKSKRLPTKTPLERKARRLSIVGKTDDFILSFKGGKRGILAELKDNGVVELWVHAGKDSPMRGFELFEEAMEHFGSQAKAIRGSWTYGDNLAEVNRLTAQGMPLEEAVLKTNTGKWSADWGFTKARVDDPPVGKPPVSQQKPGEYTHLYILFEEP